MADNKLTISPGDIPDVLERNAACGNKKPPLFLALFGIGKSSSVEAFAKSQGRTLCDVRLGYYGPTDVRGFPIPDRERGVMRFFPSEDLPPVGSTDKFVVHWDELTNALPATQKVALQGILDRRIGKYVFPEDTIMVASGNRISDKSYCERLSAALVDRFSIYHIRPDIDSFQEYLVTSGAHPLVTAFMMQNPTALYDFDIGTWDGEDNLPSARSFERLSELIASYDSGGAGASSALNDRLFTHHCVSHVGPKQGKGFAEFIKLSLQVGDIEAMLKNAKKCKIPESMSLKWIVACELISRAKEDNMDKVLTLAHRLQTAPDGFSMLEAFIGRSISKHKPEMVRSQALRDWTTKNAKNLVR